jgi:hypothetical protein
MYIYNTVQASVAYAAIGLWLFQTIHLHLPEFSSTALLGRSLLTFRVRRIT